jgi:hypothetical protein
MNLEILIHGDCPSTLRDRPSGVVCGRSVRESQPAGGSDSEGSGARNASTARNTRSWAAWYGT